MGDPWRKILHQLTAELERQSSRLRELELENQGLKIAQSTIERSLPPSSPVSPALRDAAKAESEGVSSKSEPLRREQPESPGKPAQVWQASAPAKSDAEDEAADDKASFSVIRGTRSTRTTTTTGEPTRKPWYIINPQSNAFATWQLITTIALGFVVTVVPYQVGLLELAWDFLLIASCLVDLVFLVDMALNFFTTYPRTTARGIKWEDSLEKIARHYISGWFLIDILTLIPFDIIELTSGAAGMGVGKATKAVRALRLLKLMRILKTSRWLHKLEIAISIPYQQFALDRFLLILLLVCHWLACIWAMTLQLASDDFPQWINDIEVVDIQFGIYTRNEPHRVYLSAFYFCSYTMTSVGYGDIGPKNLFERSVCTVIILAAGLCWAYVLGEVCAIVSDMNSESQAFRKKMTDLNTMMWEQGLPYELRCRLRSFFLQNRHQALYVTRQKLRDSMSPQLQSEVCIALNLAWITKVTFFSQFMTLMEENQAKGMDVDSYRIVISDISRELECGAFAQGERFDNVQVLYILSKGLVALNSRVGSNGAVWGEDFVLSDPSLIRPVRGFALTYLEVLNLTRWKFMRVIERRKLTCPQLGQIVRRFCVRLAVRRGVVAHTRRIQRLGLSSKEGADPTASTNTESSQAAERRPKQLPPPPQAPQGICQPFGSLPGVLDDVERHDVDPRDQDPRTRRMSQGQLEDM